MHLHLTIKMEFGGGEITYKDVQMNTKNKIWWFALECAGLHLRVFLNQ